MQAAGVPAAASFNATTMTEVRAALAALDGRVVVKADGLAAGKGVVVCDDGRGGRGGRGRDAGRRLARRRRPHARDRGAPDRARGVAARALRRRDRRAARRRRRTTSASATATRGPNTGGMGAYSPVPGVGAVGAAEICDVVHVPVLRELGRRGIHFSGCLYAGLMLDGRRARGCWSSTSGSATPRRRRWCRASRATFARRLLDAACGRADARRRSAFRPGACVTRRAWPRAAIRPRARAASTITGRRRRGVRPDGACRCSTPAPRCVATGSSRPAGACSASARLGDDIADARARAYAAVELIAFDGMQRRTRHRRRGRAGRGLTLPLQPGDAARPSADT